MAAKSTWASDLAKTEAAFENKLKEQKKTSDSSINAITLRLSKMEKEIEALHKEKEEWAKEKRNWEAERMTMRQELDLLKGEIASLRDRAPEEGEITIEAKEAIKEELTKALTESIEGKLEATREGWVEVVKKNLKKEVQEDSNMVQSTLNEEKMRRARRLNIRVTGIPESANSTPEMDGKALCTKLGYNNEVLPFARAWRTIPKDSTKGKALVLQFPDEVSRMTFMRKRTILRSLPGDPIYFDDDLTIMQLEHRRLCMPEIKAARKSGKKAHYRDGHIYIDGKRVE